MGAICEKVNCLEGGVSGSTERQRENTGRHRVRITRGDDTTEDEDRRNQECHASAVLSQLEKSQGLEDLADRLLA